ncbi:hypothetical protein HAX54_032768, partial [Datura stramonium]|nr:hypothetical protein [Datura stramonium]
LNSENGEQDSQRTHIAHLGKDKARRKAQSTSPIKPRTTCSDIRSAASAMRATHVTRYASYGTSCSTGARLAPRCKAVSSRRTPQITKQILSKLHQSIKIFKVFHPKHKVYHFSCKTFTNGTKANKGKGVASSSYGSKRARILSEDEHEDVNMAPVQLRRYGLHWVIEKE